MRRNLLEDRKGGCRKKETSIVFFLVFFVRKSVLGKVFGKSFSCSARIGGALVESVQALRSD